MTKDELINRVVLLGSHLSMALKEGETAIATIKNVELDLLREAASELGLGITEPKEYAPYYYFDYLVNQGQMVEVRTREYKKETVTKYT